MYNKGRHPNIKLTITQVEEIRELYSTGEYIQQELAEMYGVVRETIHYITANKTWRYL